MYETIESQRAILFNGFEKCRRYLYTDIVQVSL